MTPQIIRHGEVLFKPSEHHPTSIEERNYKFN
jgi:hypothetical protein